MQFIVIVFLTFNVSTCIKSKNFLNLLIDTIVLHVSHICVKRALQTALPQTAVLGDNWIIYY